LPIDELDIRFSADLRGLAHFTTVRSPRGTLRLITHIRDLLPPPYEKMILSRAVMSMNVKPNQ